MSVEPGSPDVVLELVAGVELPEAYPSLRSGAVDRLGYLADWWATVSAAPAPAEALLAFGGALDPEAAPRCRARLVPAATDVPAGVAEAIAWGAAEADRAVDAGVDLIVLSLPTERPDDDRPDDRPGAEPGAGVAPAHVLLAAHLLEFDAVEATGWPSDEGLTDAEWVARVSALRDGRRRVRSLHNAPQQLLAALDARWLAAGAGLLARATARRTPTLLDGAAAAACGLLVRRAEPAGRAWWQAADGGDQLHERVLQELRLKPLLQLGLESGRRVRFPGAGGRLGLALLETALAGPA